MATVPTNTRQTYDVTQTGTTAGREGKSAGIREDFSNIIYNIAPEETPFMSAIGKSSCDNTYFEWQVDTLGTGGPNQIQEGLDADALAHDEPDRIGNYTQISTKTVQTSGTAEAVDFAGRKSSQAYQMAKRAKELKLDMEYMLLRSDAPTAGTSSVARKTGGVGHWISTNKADNNNVAPDEDDIRAIMKTCWDNGASPTILMVDGLLKQAISAFSQSVSPLQTTANSKSPAYVVAAVDVYVHDFGQLKMVPNRLMPEKTGYFLDYEFWDIAYLRGFSTHDLAKTGDSMSSQLLVEYGLRSKNEAANASIINWGTV
jgi:hypothetical protein